MSTTRPPRSTRDRPAKPPLSKAAVLDAALAVCRADGVEAVTMRRVAAELDTGAASLYAYVRNRDDLVTAMGDWVASTIPRESPDPERWRAQLHRVLWHSVAAFHDHPGLAAASMAAMPDSDLPFDAVENLLGLLGAGGIRGQDAAWGCDALYLLTTATAIETELRRDRGQTSEVGMEEMVRDLRARFSGLPPARYPLLVAAAEEMVAGDGEQRFHFAVDALLDGMLARAARASAGS